MLQLATEDIRLLHLAASTTVTLYDGVEAEDGVPKEAPLYGKRDRLEELARQLDHEANCPTDSEPVVPLSEVKEALLEADQALTAWHADKPFYDPGSDSSEPFTQDAEFVTFIGHAVRDLLAAFPSTDSEGQG